MSLKDRFNTIHTETPQKQKIKELLLEGKNKSQAVKKEISSSSLGIVDTILADDEINSIFVNNSNNIYIEKKGKTTKSQITYESNEDYNYIVKKFLDYKGLDCKKEKYFSLNYKKGINLSITLSPLSSNTTLCFKCYNDKLSSLKNLQEAHSISKEVALFLECFSLLDINVLIIGEKKSLKTTLLSSLLKNIQENFRTIVIDYLNEIEIDKSSCAYYNFSIFNKEEYNKNKQIELINSLVYTSPDKIFINSINEDILDNIQDIISKNKGITLTLNANSIKEAKEKLPNLENCFDIIIQTKTIKGEVGKISSIAQVDNDLIQNIFNLNSLNRIESLGIIPKIYFELKPDSPSINQSIFNQNYKHTYANNLNNPKIQEKKNVNLEILKKFKKNLEMPNSKDDNNTNSYQDTTVIPPSQDYLSENNVDSFDERLNNE